MQPKAKRRLIITVAVLVLLGSAAAVSANLNTQRGTVILIKDLLFCQASAILIWGTVRVLGNMRMFTSVSYSFKRFHDLFRNRAMKAQVMKEDYRTYRENRPWHEDAKPLLVIGAVWMALAVAAAMLL